MIFFVYTLTMKPDWQKLKLDWPVAEAAQRLLRRNRRRDLFLEQRRTQAQAWGKHVAVLLGKQDHTLEQVIGFGSAFETWRSFREDSDIDLAVIGGSWSCLSRFIPPSEFEVSLAELELQTPEFISYVRTHGTVLYVRGETHEDS